MQARVDVLLLTAEEEASRAVRRAFAPAPQGYLGVTPVRDFTELRDRLQARPESVVLVDVDRDARGVLNELEHILAAFPESRLVLLCSEFRSELVLEAMQIGARHCLVKDRIEEDLLSVVHRQLQSLTEATGKQGIVLTVLSACGGCGATTIAINLAEEARAAVGGPVLLVDLDLAHGAISGHLGIDGRYGVADVARHAGTADADLVRSTTAKHSIGLELLLSPASSDPTGSTSVDHDRLPDVLRACMHAYPLTIADAPACPVNLAAQLAEASDLVVLVCEASVVGVRGMRTLHRAISSRLVPSTKLVAVVNRYKKRVSALSLGDIEEAVPGIEVVTVSNDYQAACRAMNLGKPLAQAEPRSPIRKDLQALLKLAHDRLDGRILRERAPEARSAR